MRFFLAVLFLILFVAQLTGQKEDYNWIIGSCVDNSTDTVNFANMQIAFTEDSFSIKKFCANYNPLFTNSSLSSSSGELLYFTNGSDILGADYEIINGGGGLQPNFPSFLPLPHSTLLLPAPGEATLSYFISPDVLSFVNSNGELTNTGKDLKYTVIQKDSDISSGIVIEKQTLLHPDTLALGLVSATQHANGRDWWIIAKKYDSNKFYVYLLDPTGIHLHELQTVGSPGVPGFGQATFSPDGNWYGIYTRGGGYPPFTDWRWDLYRFDRCTGTLSDHLPYLSAAQGVPGGLAFSPNSKLMYVSVWNEIYQYNLEAPDIINSRMTVAEYDGFTDEFNGIIIPTRFYTMQLTPHNKIFINIPNITNRYYHIINQPDQLGENCEVIQRGLALPHFHDNTIPNMPFFRPGPEIGSGCDSLSLLAAFSYLSGSSVYSFQFNDESLGQPTDWLWEFGDGSTSIQQSPMHTFPDTGSYSVCLTVSLNQLSSTTCQHIDVLPTAISIIDNFDKIDFFPNPTFGPSELHIPPGLQIYKMNLYSIDGQLIQSLEPNASINISDFAPGIYILEIWGNGGKRVERIVKL